MADGNGTELKAPIPVVTPEMQQGVAERNALQMQQLNQAFVQAGANFTPSTAPVFNMQQDFTAVPGAAQRANISTVMAQRAARQKSLMDQQRFQQSQALFPGQLAVQEAAGVKAQRSTRPEVLAQMDRARNIEMLNLENLSRQTAFETTPGALDLARGLDAARLEEMQFENSLAQATRADRVSKFGSDARIAKYNANPEVQRLDLELLQARRDRAVAETSGDPKLREAATRSESLAFIKNVTATARASYADTISEEEVKAQGIKFVRNENTGMLERIVGLTKAQKQKVRDRVIQGIEFHRDSGSISEQEANAYIKQVKAFNDFSDEEAITTAPVAAKSAGITVRNKITRAKSANDGQIQTEIERLQTVIAAGGLTAARLKLEQDYLAGLEAILFERKGGG